MSVSDRIWAKQFPKFSEKTGRGRDREILREQQHLVLADAEEDLRFAGMLREQGFEGAE
jgi:hypothetical protein